MVEHPPTHWARNPFATAIVGFTGGLLIAYAIGLWQRHAALAERDAAHAVALGEKDMLVAEAQGHTSDAQRALAAADARVALVRVRIGLLLASNDLERGDVRVAEERLRVASESIDRIDAAALGLDPASVGAVRDQIAASIIAVDRDPASRRQDLLELSERLDALGGSQ